MDFPALKLSGFLIGCLAGCLAHTPPALLSVRPAVLVHFVPVRHHAVVAAELIPARRTRRPVLHVRALVFPPCLPECELFPANLTCVGQAALMHIHVALVGRLEVEDLAADPARVAGFLQVAARVLAQAMQTAVDA